MLLQKFFKFVLVFALILCNSYSFAAIHIALEGNTGAGKSTLAELLKSELPASLVPEPFNEWLDVKGKGNLFGNFLQNGPEYSLYLTMYATITKIRSLQKIEETNPHHVILLDRSILSDTHAFSKVHREQGLLSQEEEFFYQNFLSGSLGSGQSLEDINQLFSKLSKDTEHELKQEIQTQAKSLMEQGADYKVDALIYLRTSPGICKERADFRDREFRDADAGPVGQFYEKLGAAHDEWLNNRQEILWRGKKIPVLIINGDGDFLNDNEQKAAIIEHIKSFIKNITK